MTITVLFFGKLADDAQKALGSSELSIQIENAYDIENLKNHIGSLSTDLLASIENSKNLIAVNQVMQQQNCTLNEGDEIAFMSPLSGG